MQSVHEIQLNGTRIMRRRFKAQFYKGENKTSVNSTQCDKRYMYGMKVKGAILQKLDLKKTAFTQYNSTRPE